MKKMSNTKGTLKSPARSRNKSVASAKPSPTPPITPIQIEPFHTDLDLWADEDEQLNEEAV